MKKRQFATLLAVVLVLVTCISVFAACKPKPKPPEDYTVFNAVEDISSAITNTYLYEGVPFGWDANLKIEDYSINTQGRIDVESRENTRFVFDITKGESQVINISADDTYMYATQNDWKRRFNDFQFYDMMNASSFPTQDENAEILNFITLGLMAIFSNESDTVVKTTDGGNSTIDLTGNLGSVVEALQGLLAGTALEGLTDIVTVLAECDIKLQAVISADNKLVSFDLDVITPAGDFDFGASKFQMGPACNPVVALPEGKENFITTNALNFTLQGDVTLKSDAAFNNIDDVYKMTYTLRVDYNIFGALRNSIETVDGKTVFKPEGLFSDPSNKIYFDLHHKCSTDGTPCKYCKDNRSGGSRGSMLTVAYAPEDFGNKNVNVSANLKALLPNGLLGELIDLDGMDITSMFGEYLHVGLDPLALMMNESNYKTITGAKSETTNMSSEISDLIWGLDIKSMLDPNILGVLIDVFDFAQEIKYNDADGLTMGSDQLVNMLALLDDSIGFNLSGVIGSFMTNSDYMKINVAKAEWGDPTNLTNNFYDEYMLIDENEKAYKEFSLDSGVIPAIKDVLWKKDAAGRVIINEKSILNYDADGKVLPISEQEARTLFTKGSALYDYVTLDGKKGESEVGIKAVYGIDYTSRVEQTVTVVTGMTDAGAISSLLNLVARFVGGGLDLNFAGNYFTTKVLITDTVGTVVLEQGDDVKSKYNPETVYTFQGTKVNPYFTAKVEYTDGTKKTVKLAPENMADFFYNTGTPDNASVFTAFDFDAQYIAFGEVITKKFKVEKHHANTINKNLKLNEKYKTPQRFNVVNDATEATVDVYAAKNNKVMVPTVTNGDGLGMVFTSNIEDTIERSTFSFSKAGTYEVSLLIKSGFTQTFVFNVTDGNALGRIPGYDFGATFVNDTIMVNTNRTDNYGQGMNGKFVVTAVRNGENVVLVNGTDYTLYEVVNGKRTEAITGKFFLNRSYAAGGQKFEIVVNDKANAVTSTKVALLAADFEDTKISEKGIKNAFEKYSIKTEIVAGGDTFGLKYEAICADVDAIVGLELRLEIKVKLAGTEEEWTVVATPVIGFAVEMFGTIIAFAPDVNAKFGFSNDGTTLVNEAVQTPYFIIDGFKAESKFEINVYAVNYGDALITSVTNVA